MKRFILSFTLGTMLILSSVCWGDIPRSINFQGILTNSGGSPLADTTVSVEFTIYGSSAGTDSVWKETQSVTTDNQGRFNVLLGIVTSIEDTVFKDTTRYLGVKVSTDAELMPRTKLVSVAYATRVSTIDGAKGGTITGNTSIQSDLAVNGIIDATGMSSKIRFHYNDIADFPSAATYHGMLAHAHNQGAAYYAHAASWIRLADSLHYHNSLAAADLSPNPALYVDTAGKVGIGTTTPTAKLEVLNSVSSASTEQGVNGIVSNSSTGSAFGGTFTAGSAGTGTHTGVRGNASGSSFNPAYGVYGSADNSSSGEAYGGFFNVSTGGTGTGPHYAVWGSSFGVSGPVYGGYFFTDTTGTGTKYGIYATAPTAEGDAGYFAGNATVTDTLFASNVSSLSPLRLQTGGTTRMYIGDGSGNVGIGTTSPLTKLHMVAGLSGAPNSVLMPDGYNRLILESSDHVRINFVTPNLGHQVLSFSDSAAFERGWLRYRHDVDVMDFRVAGSVRMTIDSTGAVGIGTTSPQGALDVSSTTGALIVPRMTTAQRDALTAVNGMIIYNTSTDQFNFREAGAWVTK